MREKILLLGEYNTSKTLSLISMSVQFPDKKVIVFDPDDGTAKTLNGLGLTLEDLPNLLIVPVKSDWGQLVQTYQQVKQYITPDDWVCFDMLGRFWDLAQIYYSTQVFGEDPIEHLLTLKKQARKTNFGGFDGLQDWALIKKIHNVKLLDDAVVWSDFNVMATSSVSRILPVDKATRTGAEGMLATLYGVKADGEKHNLYRFDTIAFLFREKDNSFHFQLIKDKGRPLDVSQVFDITGCSFYEVYSKYRRL